MGWIKVPPAHHPLFRDALPDDRRVMTLPMFGGVAAKVNGHIFAGLFQRSVVIWLPEADRPEALALDGAAPFDPMGTGWSNSDKIMMPEALMDDPRELRAWIARAFAAAVARPPKVAKVKVAKPTRKSKPVTKLTPVAKATATVTPVATAKATVKPVATSKPARKPVATSKPARKPTRRAGSST